MAPNTSRRGQLRMLAVAPFAAAVILTACSSASPTAPAAPVTAGPLAATQAASASSGSAPGTTVPASGTQAPVARSSAPGATPGTLSAPPAGRPAATANGTAVPVVELTPTPAVSETPEPSSGTRTATGDVPDNAIFLTYRDGPGQFSIQYVEGWQVTPQPDGVTIADKDSSEKVALFAGADATTYVGTIDLPALQAQPGFKLLKQDRVKVNGHTYDHLVYQGVSDPDPVTGKQVPSVLERYYVPRSGLLAVVTLSTPDGVDNVDAFREMIRSFTWQ